MAENSTCFRTAQSSRRARGMLGIAPWKPGEELASDALIAERRREGYVE